MEPKDQLFSGKSDNYSKYRPSYPPEILKILKEKYGLTNSMVVADVGCGTGILAALFLQNGNKVYCIDPNEEMLEIAKNELKDYQNAVFVRGYAEQTGLDDGSVNVISAGQAFHWFNMDKTKREFKRILMAPYLVVLVWNDRDNKDDFTKEYENIISHYSKGYRGTGSTIISSDSLSQFFNWSYGYYQYVNIQELDFDGLIGRYLSASYSLPKDDSRYQEMVARMKRAFDTFQKDGKVQMKYTTKLFVGRLP